MSEVLDRPDGKIVLNAEFLRAQAVEAVATFFTPLVGVYAAAKGKSVSVRRKARRSKKVA